MKKIFSTILVLLIVLQSMAQTTPTYLDWGVLPSGIVTLSGGQGIGRDGVNTSNSVNITATNTVLFAPGDQLVFQLNIIGCFNIIGVTDVRPVNNTTYNADNLTNVNVKYSFSHGNDGGGTGLYINTVEAGVASTNTSFSNSGWGRMTWVKAVGATPAYIRYEISPSGADGTFTLLRNSTTPPTGTGYYVFAHLQNSGSFSAFNQVYLIKAPIDAGGRGTLIWSTQRVP